MSARPPAPRADLPEGEATLKDAEQPETSLEARGSRGPGPFIKSRCQDRIRVLYPCAEQSPDVYRSERTTIRRARDAARAQSACKCMLRQQNSLQTARIARARSKTAPPAPRRRHARHSQLRANNCALQLVAWRARLASPRARWKCCNKPCTPASSSSSSRKLKHERSRTSSRA